MDIPSRYDPKEVEPRILKQWLKNKDFSAQAGSSKNYSIVIPPPNITGILHMGHGLNSTIQDLLIRYQRMKGCQSLWMPGTDHAGIATQNVVERNLAKESLRKEDIGREEFIKKLWAWRDEYGSTIINQLKQLGASCDWERLRFTMDDKYSNAVGEVFVKLYEKGLVYRGNYIINWCPRCKTALSDEEAAHKDIDGWLYYIKYPVKSDTNLPDDKKYIVVATTRPETMFGDTAIAINPKDKRYQWLKRVKVILPIVNKELPIVEDDAIDPEFGTGIVKVTPAHDSTDFIIGKKHNLEFINIMDTDATLNKNVPNDFIGMDRFQARKVLLTLLEDKGLLNKKIPYVVSAGHCYRCNTIIEPRMSLQWFVKMKPLAAPAIQVVEEEKIKFYPQRWKKVYLNWMHNIQDWCISRQIWWGHRLPVYYCLDCRKNVDQDNEVGIIVSKTRPKECSICGSKNLKQDEDVLDTWFSSWLWPFTTFGWPEETKDLKYFYPTDCLVTASEILFFWVARMIMASLEFTKKIPFKDVLIHGTVRDEKGIKMSKSLGNTIDPLEIIDKFGADALRFSLMLLAASGSDAYLNEEKFLVGRNFSNKIWNATRFIFLKIEENNLEIKDFKFTHLDSVDSWVLTELNSTINEVSSKIDKYSLNEATKKTYDFFWHVFCDWYIEIVKDNVNLDKAKVLVYVLLNSIKLLHPLMPFITEEIFSIISKQTNLSLEKTIVKSLWPIEYKLRTRGEEVTSLINIIGNLRNIKADLGLGQKKVKLSLCLSQVNEKFWKENITWIKRLTLSESINFVSKLERVLFEAEGLALNIDIESADLSVFLTSLDKKINNLGNVLKVVSKKLKNEKFLERASPEIVNREKKKFQDISENFIRLGGLKDVFK
ncbi:MAG: valine--tRNA ligase [Candidatus Susulua stagnicola]|nr:valine--tRNA ligase [Candidatus Susulua stagnicola]